MPDKEKVSQADLPTTVYIEGRAVPVLDWTFITSSADEYGNPTDIWAPILPLSVLDPTNISGAFSIAYSQQVGTDEFTQLSSMDVRELEINAEPFRSYYAMDALTTNIQQNLGISLADIADSPALQEMVAASVPQIITGELPENLLGQVQEVHQNIPNIPQLEAAGYKEEFYRTQVTAQGGAESILSNWAKARLGNENKEAIDTQFQRELARVLGAGDLNVALNYIETLPESRRIELYPQILGGIHERDVEVPTPQRANISQYLTGRGLVEFEKTLTAARTKAQAAITEQPLAAPESVYGRTLATELGAIPELSRGAETNLTQEQLAEQRQAQYLKQQLEEAKRVARQRARLQSLKPQRQARL